MFFVILCRLENAMPKTPAFNAVAKPAPVPEQVASILSLLDESAKPETTLAKKRTLLRKALLQSNDLVLTLTSSIAPDFLAAIGQQVRDTEKLDAGIARDLNSLYRPDKEYREHIKREIARNIEEARKSLKEIGAPVKRLIFPEDQANEEWMRAGSAASSISIAEIRVAQGLFGQTGKRPSYAPKAKTPR